MDEDTEQQVSSGILEDLLGLGARSVQQLAKDGVLSKAARGKYNLFESIRGYVKFCQERMKGYAGAGGEEAGVGSYEQHRARLYKAKADQQEMLAARMKGELHDGATIAAVMNEMIANSRSKFLAAGTILAPRVADIEDANECKELIDQVLYEALAELSNYPAEEVVARQLNLPVPSDEDDMQESTRVEPMEEEEE